MTQESYGSDLDDKAKGIVMKMSAISTPKCQLLSEIERCQERKTCEQSKLDVRYGTDRIKIMSYMENIGWPELFGYDMRRVHEEPEFAVEQRLRESIFWADNVEDDTVPTKTIEPDVGHNWHMTLFGQKICHTKIGVPEFDPHPLKDELDVSTLGHFDFYNTGVMPRLIFTYRKMLEIAADEYGGSLEISFPRFWGGPLDIYVQLRGYEKFISDTIEQPVELRIVMELLTSERLRFAYERQRFLNEEALPNTSLVSDDWVNVPFISPGIFHDFVVPAYARIQSCEGPVIRFHTCGKLEGIVSDLINVFPGMQLLEVSGWNDVKKLDAMVDSRVEFGTKIINTVSLGGSEEEQIEKLESIREVGYRRRVSVCAEAIQRLCSTYEETLTRLNKFLALARRVLYAR